MINNLKELKLIYLRYVLSFTALQMTQTLGYLDTAQQEINSSLHSHGDLLKQVNSVIFLLFLNAF